MDKYTPNPIQTSDIELSDDLTALTEALARNVHEVWAEGRIADGWSYGEVRDDINMKHPCLVSYDELTETERSYDRNTAIGTLKLIISLGYDIKKNL
ncbi:MAG: RyR domain-containing protein [Bacteroidales bacterium]